MVEPAKQSIEYRYEGSYDPDLPTLEFMDPLSETDPDLSVDLDDFREEVRFYYPKGRSIDSIFDFFLHSDLEGKDFEFDGLKEDTLLSDKKRSFVRFEDKISKIIYLAGPFPTEHLMQYLRGKLQ